MSDIKPVKRLNKVAVELNVGLSTIVDYLDSIGIKIEANPNTKIDGDIYDKLLYEFGAEKAEKEKAKIISGIPKEKRIVTVDDAPKKKVDDEDEDDKINISEILIKNVTSSPINEDVIKPKVEPISQIKVLGKIDLSPKSKKQDAPSIAAENITTEEVKKTETTSNQIKEETPIVSQIQEVEEIEVKVQENFVTEEVEIIESSKVEDVVSPPDIPVEEVKPIASTEETSEKPAEEYYRAKTQKLEGVTILGKIVLPTAPVKKEEKPKEQEKPKPVASSTSYDADKNKKKRKRIRTGHGDQNAPKPGAAPNQTNAGPNQQNQNKGNFNQNRGNFNRPKVEVKKELTDEEIQNQIKETLARLSSGGKSKASKYRREKRDLVSKRSEAEEERQQLEKSILKVTEFVTANQLATMMEVQVTQIISACMSLGIFVSINQRLDAETISIVAEEFGYKVEFVTVEDQEAISDAEDNEENLVERPPIVTVMGHVDHGKTSLLDYIRKANVIAGEAGGITQHIGAYSVKLDNGKTITFLDTPGHEAFTAMRARGAKVTDVAIIVIAADDSVMPQTREAINHAQAAQVPIVFAFNKIDKPGANTNKIREELANMNILVEDWGGKYQSQEISAKAGLNINELLEKVLLEAELLELKANPNKRASGTVIESALDKGRGYVSTILVQSGTLKVGDVVLAGPHSGRVKALHNERGQHVKNAGPATPVTILGLDGAPQAGDKFNVMTDEREAREIAAKRMQLLREQGMRTQKHITLDEIGRRLAIGDFKELNIIIKGDVDGSIEALSDSLLKLSTEKVQVNIIHKSVGQISESDVLLASASNAIIIGFQVRPSASARKLAESEQIDIRLYSIIYDAINEIKAAMEGMLSPEFVEKIIGNTEIREVFKITKVGSVAGCYVTEGKITRNSKIRVIRDGIVIYSGDLGSLKRFKDDVKEVTYGYECGLNIANYNDIKVGDIIEAYEMVEVKAKL